MTARCHRTDARPSPNLCSRALNPPPTGRPCAPFANGGYSMFKMLMAAVAGAAVLMSGSAQAADISGAGATFPAPVYAKWAEMYRAQTGNKLNYQAIGSG